MFWLCFLTVSLAWTMSAQNPCCFPSRFQAFSNDIGTDDNLVENATEEFSDIGLFAFDYPNNKIFYRLVDKEEKTRNHYFLDYNKNLEYEMLVVGDCAECKIRQINEPLGKCVHENATLVVSISLGFGSEQLTIDTWEYPTAPNSLTYRMTVTHDACY